MRPLRRAMALIPTALALWTFLLPSGWAICIGPEGHLAVEPAVQVGATCCAPPTSTQGTESCVPDSGSDCEDIALGTGAARLSRPDPETGAAHASQWVVTLPGMTLRNATCLLPPQPLAGVSAHPYPGARTTILRC